MNVLFLSPGYPAEMPFFVRGLAAAGARVLGVGDQHEGALPERARGALSGYLRVASLWDEARVVAEVAARIGGTKLDRVECLWEPGMLLAARLREALGVPGLTVEQTLPFRDKERMKLALDRARVRTPRHARAATAAACREAAERIGWPVVVKPIAGAGSMDTYRVADERELEQVLPRLRHVPEVSVEEFIDGEEYTFDTVCAGGRVLFHNVSWYRPRPLIGRSNEWVSPQTIALRDPDVPALEPGRRMGLAVLRALGFETGFTHMEWFLKADGEAVFGEVAARPPGARSVDLMNYACDLDLFAGWGEAVCRGRLPAPVERRWNAAVVFKRARGRGRIARVHGLERLLAELGDAIVAVDLLPVGAPRRDWVQTLLSDGHVILRHPDLATTCEMADRVGVELQIDAA